MVCADGRHVEPIKGDVPVRSSITKVIESLGGKPKKEDER
jgi:hypothetical protein